MRRVHLFLLARNIAALTLLLLLDGKQEERTISHRMEYGNHKCTYVCVYVCVMLNKSVPSLRYKYQKQTLLLRYYEHHGYLCRHNFTEDPNRSQKHCVLSVLLVVVT